MSFTTYFDVSSPSDCLSVPPPSEDHQQRICELETTLLGLEQSLNKLEHRNESLQHQLTSTSAAAAAEEHNRCGRW